MTFLKDQVWEARGNSIPPGMVVSQKNGNPLDCRYGNLQLVPESEYPGGDGQPYTMDDVS